MKTLLVIASLVAIVLSMAFTITATADRNNHYPLPDTTPIHIQTGGGCIDQYIAAGLYPGALSAGWSDGLCGHAPIVHCGDPKIARHNPWYAFRHGCTDQMPSVIDPQGLH